MRVMDALTRVMYVLITVMVGGQVVTTVLEQPLDLSNLSPKYEEYATAFIAANARRPFFLYMPFSHVHTTADNQPEEQYCDCEHKNATKRGATRKQDSRKYGCQNCAVLATRITNVLSFWAILS